MSHFSILVIGPDVDGQLARYDEGIQVAPYKVHEATPWFAEAAYKGAGVLANDLHGLVAWYDHTYPEEKGNWKIDDEGLYEMSAYNPHSKWDWYVIGGRWGGFLKMKPGRTGDLGPRHSFDEPPALGGADIALVGDVDWEAMIAQDQECRTYAVVAEGAWKAKGEMGWFGMSRGDRDDWTPWWQKFVLNLPADTPVTVVDAHI
jgi:hypothetical protein